MKLMMVILTCLITGIVAILFFFSFISLRRKEKLLSLFKKKTTWVICGLIIISPFLLYSIITILLINIRGDCFPAYYVVNDNVQYLCYEGNYYSELIDTSDINAMYAEVNGDWSEEEQYMLSEPVKFPYAEYWIPGYFLDEIKVSSDDKYVMIIKASVKDTYYIRR